MRVGATSSWWSLEIQNSKFEIQQNSGFYRIWQMAFGFRIWGATFGSMFIVQIFGDIRIQTHNVYMHTTYELREEVPVAQLLINLPLSSKPDQPGLSIPIRLEVVQIL